MSADVILYIIMWIVPAWEFGGPLIGLVISGYLSLIFGIRIWLIMAVTFLVTFCYFELRLAEYTMFNSWEFNALMAFHSAWNVALLIWLIGKAVRAIRGKRPRN
ncbi:MULTISPECIES: hypothetical protein [Bacillales]|jgi:hypothetical protein|uniref:Phage holin n=1 Tax=Brevibacillus aydinogluensis TaxID=927786 RepID=A0AA48RB31_9BACL|nr:MULTISPECIES: hypothetical protein [Bacillales]REK60668.1 MAG: hypothetical protein DF221_18445 [Brevibacillus sp.]MBR8659798.1 hypothetical protein [Brevibacillus sp. NL20B1]MDT3416600.1 hypothetical protein [Brevibacillus aydinogluensis]NNV01219.1 hypothetical protein [Brevibacillus sp. MCWH]UFJ62076.1 hypothetical protein IRT44_04420 [Anoxybacillus sediminis]